jgi:hypothetical protein
LPYYLENDRITPVAIIAISIIVFCEAFGGEFEMICSINWKTSFSGIESNEAGVAADEWQ